jgi:hypothetical protein
MATLVEVCVRETLNFCPNDWPQYLILTVQPLSEPSKLGVKRKEICLFSQKNMKFSKFRFVKCSFFEHFLFRENFHRIWPDLSESAKLTMQIFLKGRKYHFKQHLNVENYGSSSIHPLGFGMGKAACKVFRKESLYR